MTGGGLCWEFGSVRSDNLLALTPRYHVFILKANYPLMSTVDNIQYDSLSRIQGSQSRFRWTLRPGNEFHFVDVQNWLQDPSGEGRIILVTCTTRIGSSADGCCRGDRGARRKSMSSHQRRLATKISPATPIGPKGSGETALSSLSSPPRNVGPFTRCRDVVSSPCCLLESNAVWSERCSRCGWYRPRGRTSATKPVYTHQRRNRYIHIDFDQRYGY